MNEEHCFTFPLTFNTFHSLPFFHLLNELLRELLRTVCVLDVPPCCPVRIYNIVIALIGWLMQQMQCVECCDLIYSLDVRYTRVPNVV